jgi:hypothetical protein
MRDVYLLGRRRVNNELLALGNVAVKTVDGDLEKLLLVVVGLGKDVVSLSGTLRAELDRDREEGDTDLSLDVGGAINTVKVDVGGLDDALLTSGTLEDSLGKPETSLGHGEGSGSKTVLSLDNLVTTKLDSLDEVVELVGGDLDLRLGQRQERDNGVSGVATNDGDVELGGVRLANNSGGEGLGSDNVKGGDTEELLRVEDVVLLEDLGSNRDGRVDGVGDDEHKGVRGVLGDTGDEISDDTSVDLEQIVSGHTGLSGDTGGDNDNVGAGQSVLETVILGEVASDLSLGGDVGEVSGNTGGVDDIVESKLGHVRREFEEKRKGLANTTSGSGNDSFNH